MNKFKKGFTLIELLVVIGIIGLLSSVVLASLNKARAKARDTARIEALVQMRNALEVYFVNVGSYPLVPSSNPGVVNPDESPVPNAYYISACGNLPAAVFSGLTPKYIPAGNFKGDMCYFYASDGSDYHLVLYPFEQICANSAKPESSLCDFSQFSSTVNYSPKGGIYTPKAKLWWDFN